MARDFIIPAYFDSEGELWGYDIKAKIINKFNKNKHKTWGKMPIKGTPRVYSYGSAFIGLKSGCKIISIPGDSENTGIYTVIKQESSGVVAISTSGATRIIPLNSVQSYLSTGKINNLAIKDGHIYLYGDTDTIIPLTVPDYLSDLVDSEWNIKNGTDDTYIEPNSSDEAPKEEKEKQIETEQSSKPKSIQDIIKKKLAEQEVKAMEDNKPKQIVVDVKYNITDENKNDDIGVFSYVNFYKAILNNARVGDILSIPSCILPELKCEFIKVLNSTESGNKHIIITRLKTSDNISNQTIGILMITKNDDYVTYQIMRKPLDANSQTIADIEINYYKWKQSRKFID